MKINFICFKISKTIFFMVCIILVELAYFGIQIKNLLKEEKSDTLQQSVEEYNEIESSTIKQDIQYTSTNAVQVESHQLEEKSRIMPTEFKGFEIIGKLEIPKLNIDKYILKESSSKALKVSVTKLYGPEINEIGNFCIAGHNYSTMLKGIKSLEKKDKIILTDVFGDSVCYEVYDNYQSSPKDVSCLNQNTGGEKEVTLITCTPGAINRVIVKAVEVYD